MRRSIAAIVVFIAVTTLAGCDASPTAPRQTGAAEFDPAPLFAKLAGPYTLTFQADESCPVPPSLKVLTYDVSLEQTRFRYLGVRVTNKPLVGDLWALATEEQGFTLRWNVDCDSVDTVESTAFYLCGQGAAFASDGSIAGMFVGGYRPFCTNGAHRFVFRRRS